MSLLHIEITAAVAIYFTHYRIYIYNLEHVFKGILGLIQDVVVNQRVFSSFFLFRLF